MTFFKIVFTYKLNFSVLNILLTNFWTAALSTKLSTMFSNNVKIEEKDWFLSWGHIMRVFQQANQVITIEITEYSSQSTRYKEKQNK